MDQVIGYRFPTGAGCQAIHEDADGRQYVLDDEGRRVYGVYQIPEKKCLRTGASPTDPVIGERLFTDGVVRQVFAGDLGQYVLGRDGERVYGVWVLVDEDAADKPVIVGR